MRLIAVPRLLAVLLAGFGLWWPVSPAQAQNWQWAQAPTVTAAYVGATASVADAAGNQYVTGAFNGRLPLGSTTLVSTGTRNDIFIAKLSSAGQWLWAVQLGGTNDIGDETGVSLAVDAGGDVYATGLFRGIMTCGATTLTSAGNLDVFIGRLTSATGAWVWAARAGSAGNDQVHTIAVDPSGNGYVLGSFGPAATIGTLAVNTSNGTGQVLARFTATGTWQWANATTTNYYHALTIDGSSNAMLAGTTGGTAPYLFVKKLSPANQWLWTAQSATGTSAANVPNAEVVGVDPTGRLYVAGSVWGTSQLGTLSFGIPNQWTRYVARLSATGVWQRVTPLDMGFSLSNSRLVADAAGNAYLLGSFGTASLTVGSTTLTSRGGADVVLACLNNTGTWQWATQAGGTNADTPVGLGLDANNRLFLMTRFRYNTTLGTTTLTGHGNTDLASGQLNTAGVWQWAVRAGGTGGEAGSRSVVRDAAGNLFVGGFFRGTIQFGGVTLTAPDTTTWGYVARYSAAGVCQWARAIGQAAPVLALDGSGNLYAAGRFRGVRLFGSTTLTSAGGDDLYVAKLNTAGVVTRATRAGGSADDALSGLAVDAAGSAWITGQLYASAAFGGTTLTGAASGPVADTYVARLSAAGTWQWARLTTTNPLNPYDLGTYAAGIAVDASGNAYITGSFSSPVSFGTTALTPAPGAWGPNGMPDAYVAKLNASGVWQWARQIGGGMEEAGRAIAVDGSGNVVVAGSFGSEAINIGTQTLQNADRGFDMGYFEQEHPDVFVARLSSAGTWQWAAQGGGGGVCGLACDQIVCPPDYDMVNGLALDAAGNAYITGYAQSQLTTFGTTVFDSYNGNRFVAKLSTSGAWAWALPAQVCYEYRYTYNYNQFDPTPQEQGSIVTGSGLYVAGSFRDTGKFGSTTITASPQPSSLPFLAAVDLLAPPPVLPPAITGVAPSTGTVGTVVTLTGTSFTGATSVTLNNSIPVPFTVVNAGTITVTIPAGAQSGSFYVTTAAGTGSSVQYFYFTPAAAPKITSFTPSSGPTGTVVSISGTDLLGATAVNFNSVAATSFTVNSAASITATVPPGASTGKISVTTPSGAGSSVASFTVIPTLTGFSPASGAPGTVVTITGTGFSGVTSVKFNGVACPVGTFTIVSGTTITATVPPLATTGKVALATTGSSIASAANFTVGPIITGFTPSQGAPGSVVLVTGLNFVSGTTVKFNGVAATTSYNSGTQLTAVVPTTATTGLLSVSNTSGASSSSANYTVLTGARPTISSLSPTANVLLGTVVTITGTNFTGTTAVRFNATNAVIFTVVSATQVQATVPVGASTGRVYVTTPAGMAQSSASLVIVQPPTITSFTPASGPAGTLVTINGTNLSNASALTFSGMPAASYTVVSSSRITAEVPAGAPSGPLRVTTVAGSATSANSFTRTGPRPAPAAEDQLPLTVRLAPNPAHAWVEVDISGLPSASVPAELIDALGRVVRRPVVSEGLSRLSLAGLTPGTYVFRIAGHTQRLLVE